MAQRHDDRTKQHRTPLSQYSIGDPAAENGREIDARGICAEDGAGEGLAVDSAIQRAKLLDPCNAANLFRFEQEIDHVEHEQCLHAVIGKPLPRFREGEVAKPFGMSEETAILGVVQPEFGSRFGDGHARILTCKRPPG